MNTPKNSNSPTKDERPRSLLEVLLGAKVEDANLSPSAIEKALELRIEQERTRQQFYKLETSNRSIELLRMAKDYGVASHDIPKLFNGAEVNLANSSASTGASNVPLPTSIVTDFSVKQPLSYKFPPAGSSLRPKPVSGDLVGLPARRTNSPARIGANAVAALNEAALLKEEHHSPRLSPFATQNHTVANHNRNLSLPITKLVSPNIPSGMTSILSFGKDANDQQPANPGLGDSNNSGLRKAPMVQKKHRRARSVSSFGVIDLNMIDTPKQSSLPKLKTQDDSLPNQASNMSAEKRYDYDEITCSESSSRNESPTQSKNPNSVAKLLNSG